MLLGVFPESPWIDQQHPSPPTEGETFKERWGQRPCGGRGGGRGGCQTKITSIGHISIMAHLVVPSFLLL